MKVKEVMTRSEVCCGPETNVGRAAELMWTRNIGMLPVVDSDGKLIGVVTDRDIGITIGPRDRLPGELTVGEVTIRKVFTCKPSDDVHDALHEVGNQIGKWACSAIEDQHSAFQPGSAWMLVLGRICCLIQHE